MKDREFFGKGLLVIILALLVSMIFCVIDSHPDGVVKAENGIMVVLCFLAVIAWHILYFAFCFLVFCWEVIQGKYIFKARDLVLLAVAYITLASLVLQRQDWSMSQTVVALIIALPLTVFIQLCLMATAHQLMEWGNARRRSREAYIVLDNFSLVLSVVLTVVLFVFLSENVSFQHKPGHSPLRFEEGAGLKELSFAGFLFAVNMGLVKPILFITVELLLWLNLFDFLTGVPRMISRTVEKISHGFERLCLYLTPPKKGVIFVRQDKGWIKHRIAWEHYESILSVLTFGAERINKPLPVSLIPESVYFDYSPATWDVSEGDERISLKYGRHGWKSLDFSHCHGKITQLNALLKPFWAECA